MPTAKKAQAALERRSEDVPPEVKERIRTAALTLFGQKGYDAVTIRQICELADTTLAMVYYYFGNKKGLYRSVLRDAVQGQKAQIDRVIKSKGSPEDRMRWVLEAWLGVGQDAPVKELRLFFVRELLGLGSDEYRRSASHSDRTLRQALKRIIEDGIECGVFRPVKVDMAVLAITGIVNTFMRRIAIGSNLRLEDGVEQVMDTFINGLGAHPRPVPDQA